MTVARTSSRDTHSPAHTLSLGAAILINLNIMLGTGIFINTTELARWAGALGSLSYGLVGLLMLPLILSIARLMKIHPSGGFYTFGKSELGPLAGFIAAWSYFTAKLASATLMVHVSCLLFQQLFPDLQGVSVFALDVVVIALFCSLNLLHLKTGKRIQASFMVMKAMPILWVILGGVWYVRGAYLASDFYLWSGLPLTLPLVLYAFSGFEATCSLSASLKDPEKNGPRAILVSCAIVILIAMLYQLMFFGVLGPLLSEQKNFITSFPLLINAMVSAPALAAALRTLLYVGIAASALGGSYGILFSNTWNLYHVASHGHTFFKKQLTYQNRYQIPIYCVLVELLFCMGYLLLSGGVAVALQQISALGGGISYTLSVLAFLRAHRRGAAVGSPWVAWCALGSCLLLTSACVRNFFVSGVGPLCGFVVILSGGLLMFVITQARRTQS